VANGRQPVGIGRKIVAAVLGTVAVFIMLFGLGMSSGSIVVLGVVLLVLAIGSVTFPGLGSGTRAWVAGTAYVRSVSEPPTSSEYGRCEMQILIDAPGLPPQSIKIRDPRVPVAKWPEPGATLPITVAIDDPRHVRIMWDDVLTRAEAAAYPEPSPSPPPEEPLDDLLIDEPPWARRAPEDDLPQAGPPESGRTEFSDRFTDQVADTFADDLERLAEETERRREQPVVVHQPPGGPIVVEGTVVDTPARTIPLPRQPEAASHISPQIEPTRPERRESAPPESVAEPAPADPASPGAETRALFTEVGSPETANGSGSRDGAPMAATPLPTPGTPPINGVGITMLVADLDRSLAFYRDILGFTEIDSGEGNAVLASGGARVVLRAIRDIAPINRRLVHLNLEVDDLDAVYAELHEKGVRFTYAPRVVNRGERLELWAAAFRDPDGHGIAITQWREHARSQV